MNQQSSTYSQLKVFDCILVGLALLCLCLGSLATRAAEPAQLQSDYAKLSSAALKQLATADYRQGNLRGLEERVRSSLSNERYARALIYIVANRELLMQNIDDRSLAYYIDTLLANHAEPTAQDLLEQANYRAGQYSLARMRLSFARHYAARADWDATLQVLQQIDIANVLDSAEGDEAYISFGVALQGKKRHREALNYYGLVEADSPHYRLAQLNMALANIRQDWWSDAQLAIDSALKSKPGELDEMSNRLYGLLGFMQIQYGFYRDARQSFREVQIDSAYANRALLGLGLAALHQEDMIGALNAFNHLKAKKSLDNAVIESYLLSGFVLDRLGQQRSASATYGEATAFYQQLMGRYDAMLARSNSAAATITAEPNLLQEALAMVSSTQRQQLQALLRQIHILDELVTLSAATKQAGEIADMNQQFRLLFAKQLREAIDERKQVVASYLSQSRYGLAQLYDEAQ